ncbi:asparagine synthetase A [Acetivibrio saccincola]|uniref:asparagine synthetase A n=1 Tax=Acetivibrio saccincola TaxID=1677857 RepID=UPI000A7AAEB5|nr:asparagine synthetase A [Acetivibrio saccincola]NLW26323.1 asparaginase [Acetivibrio saccincola]
MNSSRTISPRKSWKDLKNHYIHLFEDPWYKILAEVQNLISIYTMEFYKNKNIKTLYLPVTTGSISSPMGLGSDSSPVKVELCGVETYLADSMQFMLEYGCRMFKEGCYYIMPSFRGEEADERHLCQFYHSEAEIPGTLDDVMKLVEEYLIYLSRRLLEEFSEQMFLVNGDNSHIERFASSNRPIERITMQEALKLLESESDECFDTHSAGFKVINRHGEKRLMSMFDGVVWLTHFDHLSVPFYQCFDKYDRSKALNADLLMGIGEVVGSGERHETGKEVMEALDYHEVSREEYEWYCTMKEKYPMKTSGFGLGIERFILWLFKHDDIRDCQILPRFNGVNIVP